MIDRYLTINKPTEQVLYKEKGSKFYAYAFPLIDPDQVNDCIAPLRKAFPKANHHCYAWRIGIDPAQHRANDDGEPNHSAGDPIYGQILSHELSDILIVVTRLFGGTKLGVSGLIHAYKTSAAMAIEQARITERIITKEIKINFGYEQMDKVMRLIEQNSYSINVQNFTSSCEMNISVPLTQIKTTLDTLNKMYPITASLIEE